VALLLTGSPVATRPSLAQTTEDLQRISAHLSALGPAEPLPDSPVNRDVGQIAVIGHDGSSYDRLADGQPNYLARERVGRRFYATHADEYGFLACSRTSSSRPAARPPSISMAATKATITGPPAV
jgi:hypothetical protein